VTRGLLYVGSSTVVKRNLDGKKKLLRIEGGAASVFAVPSVTYFTANFRTPTTLNRMNNSLYESSG